MPFNEIVSELLGSTGGTFGNPATNFYQVERDQLKLSENVAQVFMGMRLQCAQCHNHPFDRWTQNDYYSWAAFFAQIGRKAGVDPREQIIYNRGSGETKHVVDGRTMPPKFLGGETPDVKGKDRRKILGDWLASTKANPTNESDVNNFAKARIRRQRAEVMLDTITQVTETKNKFKGLPLGSRAVQIADGNTTDYFLTTFGRATRETVCSCEVKMDPSLSQALHLMNGTTVSTKIDQGGLVKRMLAEKKTPEQIIDDIYIRSLTRKPTAEEKKQLLEQVTAVGADVAQQTLVLNDVFWAVLNSKEYMFNH